MANLTFLNVRLNPIEKQPDGLGINFFKLVRLVYIKSSWTQHILVLFSLDFSCTPFFSKSKFRCEIKITLGLFSLPCLLMSCKQICYLSPFADCSSIDRKSRDFLWGDSSNSRKVHLETRCVLLLLKVD